MIGSILNLLITIPKLVGLVESVVQDIVMWYVQRQTSASLKAIADAAALASGAETDDQRFQAAQKWQAALNRPITLSS